MYSDLPSQWARYSARHWDHSNEQNQVLRARRKSRVRERRNVRSFVLHRVIKKDLSDKATFEQRPDKVRASCRCVREGTLGSSDGRGQISEAGTCSVRKREDICVTKAEKGREG